ncbi:transcriptional regulator [Paenibacillus sp. MZ04-78.2]|uniref:GbsR/MarR family transcriptional regulator n=1 Tax=Paenibacillus sp. MZ04-78.2 TaxID=2962034 RepID=UPI0020B64919|nr:transcriptional regulator [Paenibacillus sp. MZ04-78.2]MCP3776591.1 transcriptional regulator [Paenibacillus sp. MZ04-78.2]
MSEQEVSALKNQLALRGKVIDAIADTMDLYGVTHSAGKLYGILFFEEAPMTLEDMKDVMGMSKSNMSYAVRVLLDTKMVQKLENKQERKDLYQAEGNFFTAFQNFFATKLQREIQVMMTAIDETTPGLKELILHIDTPEEVRRQALKDLHKLVHAEQYYQWLQTFVDHIKEGKIFQQVTGSEAAAPPS